MKKIRILVMLLLPLMGLGQNVSVNKAEDKSYAPAATAVLELQTADMSNNAQVNNFNSRAIQKLKDFYNYLTIISNQSYNAKLRDEAKKQAAQLFYKSGCQINGNTVQGFIDSCGNPKGIHTDKIKSTTDWKALNISVSKNFTPAPDDTITNLYNGELVFDEYVNGALIARKRAAIILSKDEKQFGGNRREDLWTVYICTLSNY